VGFAAADFPAGLIPTFWSALKQVLLVFLVPHNFFYNSNLWTMFNEFYGSLLVFALSGISLRWLRAYPFGVAIAHVGLALALYAAGSALVDFVIGSGIAYWMANRTLPPTLRRELAWLGMLIAVIGFSCDFWIGHVCASSAVMLILLTSPSVARALSGRGGATLGLMSFPIYLVHTLVILGLSSWVFTILARAGLGSVPILLLTLSVTLGGTALTCLPLVWVEKAWVPTLNALMRRMIPEVGRSDT
jgi:peptidoglycan/LPS O-acetylase OafA/YrhL